MHAQTETTHFRQIFLFQIQISIHIPKPNLYNMVCIGFRDARRDIQDPPPAQLPPSPPDPHDEDARPDQEEMEEAINSFLQQLDKQEKKGFKDLASLLSLLPKPASLEPLAPCPWPMRSRLGFSRQGTKRMAICSLRQSFACTSMLRTTG